MTWDLLLENTAGFKHGLEREREGGVGETATGDDAAGDGLRDKVKVTRSGIGNLWKSMGLNTPVKVACLRYRLFSIGSGST